jgi:hypothetical protein
MEGWGERRRAPSLSIDIAFLSVSAEDVRLAPIGVRALVGTRKGLFVLRGDGCRRNWHAEDPTLARWGVYHATVDARDGTVYAAANNRTYGPTVQRSTDGGKTWKRSKQLRLPEGSHLKVNAAWHIEPGRPEEPDTLYLGADPGVIFRSSDGGETWEPNRGILEHPTRDRWIPGAGGICCHSIQLDPSDPLRMYVGITAAGTFRTDDGGEIWTIAHQERRGRLPSRRSPAQRRGTLGSDPQTSEMVWGLRPVARTDRPSGDHD